MENELQNSQKWLVVFLIYADFTLEGTTKVGIDADVKSGLNRLFKDILVTRIDPALCRVFVLMDRITFRSNNSNQRLEQVVKFEITNNDSPLNQIETCEIVKNLILENAERDAANPHSTPFQRPEQLADVLSKISVNPDEEILLCTWDHGSAYGIFGGDTKIIAPYGVDLKNYMYLKYFWDRIVEEKLAPGQADPIPPLDTIKTIKKGCTLYRTAAKLPEDGKLKCDKIQELLKEAENIGTQKTEMLTTRELSLAIGLWLDNHADQHGKKRKVGVLLMMNCYMMNVHSMVNLRDNVTCLVGSQTSISNPGYNYKHILKRISKQGKDMPTEILSPQRLAEICVYSAGNKSARKRAISMGYEPADTIDTWALFAIDLQCRENEKGEPFVDIQIDRIIRLLSDLAGQYRGDPNEKSDNEQLLAKREFVRCLINYSRLVMFDFAEGNYVVDVVNWLALVNAIDTATVGSKRVFTNGQSGYIKELQNHTRRITDGAKGCVLTTINEKFKYMIDKDTVITPAPTGFGVFFPASSDREYSIEAFNAHAKGDILLEKSLKEWRHMIEDVNKDVRSSEVAVST